MLGGFCLAEVRSSSVATVWPRSARARWLLLGRSHFVLSSDCVPEVMATSAASPASCGSCTASSGRRGPTSSRPGVPTCSEVRVFFSTFFSLGFVLRAVCCLRILASVRDRSCVKVESDPSCAGQTWISVGFFVPFVSGCLCSVSLLPVVLSSWFA